MNSMFAKWETARRCRNAGLLPIALGQRHELIGEIAAMVDLGAQSKTAAHKDSAIPAAYRRSAKLVAGARNHLYRTAVRWP
jgi:hypothetical protein